MRIYKIRTVKEGKHIKDTIFIGEEGKTLQNAGTVIFTKQAEWQEFGVMLMLGADQMNKNFPRVKVINEGWDGEK